jgi:hypothetical protein
MLVHLAMRIPLFTTVLALLGACRGEARAPTRADLSTDPCDKLASLQLPQIEIVHAVIVKPALCRVEAVARPTADSHIKLVVVIPVGDAWNGRYRQLGNGGFAGQVLEDDVLEAAKRGDAAAGTDDGHDSKRAINAEWALGHPELVIDFGWRAVHLTHDAALAIIQAYRKRAPREKYFNGCSDGGREGLMEAQRFPDDFDGIVVGAPANHATRLLASFAAIERALDRAPISAAKLPAIEAAALAACADPADDGVIADPLACHFDPATLRCTGAEDDHCLTDAQVTALRAVYAGPRDAGGAPAFSGLEPGAEAEPGSWAPWVTGTGAASDRPGLWRFAATFYRFAVFADAQYDFTRGQLDRELAASASLAPTLDADSTNLDAFAKRGGKLLAYHGWNDQLIPPRDSIAYYEAVRARAGDVSSFYRLFMVPGMLHCEGGRGPQALPLDQAIEAWVEHGQAPAQLDGVTARGATWRVPAYPGRAQRLLIDAPGSGAH